MAFDYSKLVGLSSVTTAGTTHTMYTNPSATTTYVRQILIHGADLTGFSASTLSMYSLYGSADYAQVTNCFFLRSITTNETYLLDLGVPGLVLKSADESLRMVHRSMTTLNYYVMGGIEV